MENINNHYHSIANTSKYNPPADHHKGKKYSFLNIFNAISSVSVSTNALLINSISNNNTSSYNNILSYLRSILLPNKEYLLPTKDDTLIEIHAQGREIMRTRDKIIQEKISESRPLCSLSLSSKTAILGAVIVAGSTAAGAAMNFRRFTETGESFAYEPQSDDFAYRYHHMNDDIKISLPGAYDYPTTLKDKMGISIRTGSFTADFHDEMIADSLHLKKRISKRSISKNKSFIKVKIRNALIPSRILRIIRDNKIDWHARDELYLIMRLAQKSEDIIRLKSEKKRNLMLLIKCIQLTKDFICQKDKYLLHKDAHLSGHLIMSRLLSIINNLNTSNKVNAWQLLIDNGLIIDKLPMQKLTMKLMLSMEKKLLDKNRVFSVRKKYHLEKTITPTHSTLNRNDINKQHQLYYINEEKSTVKSTQESNGTNVDDVKMESLYKCRDERQNLNSTDILRIISRTMMNPVAEFINEGLIVYHYDYLGEGCKNNENLYETSKKIEDLINNFLSLNPEFGNLRAGIQIMSGLLDLMADDIDGKELSLDKIAMIDSDLRAMFKGVISSVTTEQLYHLSEKQSTLQVMLEKLKLKRGVLSIQTEEPTALIETKEIYNHFVNQKNEDILFFNEKNNWVINKNSKLTHVIKDTFDKAQVVFQDSENIISIKNSSPEFYQDGIILNNGKNLFILIDDTFRYAREIKFIDHKYRYFIADDVNPQNLDKMTPIIYQGGGWHPEDKTSRVISDELAEFIKSNEKISDKLVSKYTTHSDVSPLTLGRNIQTDKYNKNYLKIDDKYFLLQMDKSGAVYIEGELDKLHLNKIKENYSIKEDIRERLLAISRTELTSPIKKASDRNFFLDNSVILAIDKGDFWDSGRAGRKMEVTTPSKLSPSRMIEGGVRFGNDDYFSYHGYLIRVINNGDDTFTLKSAINAEKEITVYKNTKSNTYYHLANKDKFSSKKLSSHCITKRQVLSICDTVHHETPYLNKVLQKNINHAVIIDSPDNMLTPSKLTNGIYKNKNNELLYYFNDNKYFYCLEEPDEQLDLTPAFFTIYGKKENGDIDLSIAISKVALVKDFDTKEVIMSTPLEAQELVFNIDEETSKILLEWQRANFHGDEITIRELNNLPSALAEYNDFSDVNYLLIHGGKKNINTIQKTNNLLDDIIRLISKDYENVKLTPLEKIAQERQINNIAAIYDSAFTRAFLTLQKAISTVKSNTSPLYEYIINKLNISDVRARFLFINSLKRKLDRISIVLDSKDRSNIMILTGEIPGQTEYSMPTDINDMDTLGFTPCHDPLDRVIINALSIPEKFDPVLNPPQGSPKQEFFINVATDTMLHEAVHVTGPAEDYIYIKTNIFGHLQPIEDALSQIEISIGSGQMKSEFSYLSKIYFSVNPVYHKYNIDDLMRPRNLRRIYQKDNYFKTLLLLNNPDTLTLIIKDLAGL